MLSAWVFLGAIRDSVAKKVKQSFQNGMEERKGKAGMVVRRVNYIFYSNFVIYSFFLPYTHSPLFFLVSHSKRVNIVMTYRHL